MVEICSETRLNRQGKDSSFSLINNFDSKKSLLADIQWGQFLFELFEKVETAGFQIDELLIEDSHWQWNRKARVLLPPHYEWFFLEADKKIQAVMIIFHPKDSRIDKESIVYIDYLAVAPWNRTITDRKKNNIFHEQYFKGLGTFVIQKANQFLGKKLKYREGFSLHSLPDAIPFYKNLGMINFGPDPTKQNLHYFEMEKKRAKEFINGS